LITLIKYGEKYKIMKIPLCIFLHSTISSSLIGPNIFLSIYVRQVPLHHIMASPRVAAEMVSRYGG